MPEQGARLQNVRGFTVRILKSGSDAVVGTGVIVTLQGGILTCAHVVEAAVGMPFRDIGASPVDICFPRLAPDVRNQTAHIVHVFSDSDDDIVLLQVTPPLMLGPDQVALLGRASESKGNRFESYGYRKLDGFAAGWAYGIIQGAVDPPEGGVYRSEPIQLNSDQINHGMSGAAVLDQERNLVVGLVSDTWFSDGSGKDRDTAWAVDGQVLTFDPFRLPLRDDPVPLLPAPQPRIDGSAVLPAGVPALGVSLNTAPDVPHEWVGRADLLAAVTGDWTNPDIAITSLIGFGGEGKSSLARKWLQDLVADPKLPQPDGIFWWGFSEKCNVDEFFEALVRYMSRGQIDAGKMRSVSAKAQVAGAMLASGRYLFVLDGLEVMQYRDGERYGDFQSEPLAELISYIAAPTHQSFAILTSRVQLHDLAGYVTYRERGVARLTDEDGVALLLASGCHGPHELLRTIVGRWDGHALTLSLLGSYVKDRSGGDIVAAGDLPLPAAGGGPYERVKGLLVSYDQRLTAAERALLMLVSACRVPMPPALLGVLAGEEEEVHEVLRPLRGFTEGALEELTQRLLGLRILRRDDHDGKLTAHPLVRSHYQTDLAIDEGRQVAVHMVLLLGFLNVIGFELEALDKEPEIPSLAELPPLDTILPAVESVYHACRAGRHDLGILIHARWIARGLSNYLSSRYGAHTTELDLCLNFFPGGNLNERPLYASYQNKAAMPLLTLGRVGEAIALLKRNTADRTAAKQWVDAGFNYSLLTNAHALVGDLQAAEDSARRALSLFSLAVETNAERADNVAGTMWQYEADIGWILSLRGQYEEADGMFARAQQSVGPTISKILVSRAATLYVEHLIRTGRASPILLELLDVSRRLAEATSRRNDLIEVLRVNALLMANLGIDTARDEFDLAVRAAREWGGVPDSIAAEVARGDYVARHGDLDLAFQDLTSARQRAADAHFVLSEIDADVALGWWHLKNRDEPTARAQAQRARQASEAIGYRWGEESAAALLAELGDPK